MDATGAPLIQFPMHGAPASEHKTSPFSQNGCRLTVPMVPSVASLAQGLDSWSAAPRPGGQARPRRWLHHSTRPARPQRCRTYE